MYSSVHPATSAKGKEKGEKKIFKKIGCGHCKECLNILGRSGLESYIQLSNASGPVFNEMFFKPEADIKTPFKTVDGREKKKLFSLAAGTKKHCRSHTLFHFLLPHSRPSILSSSIDTHCHPF